METEFISSNKAKVRFYTIPIKNSGRPLKLDFVEDVLIKRPKINKLDGVRVYSVEDLYLHKLGTISGTKTETDEIGRQVMQGRNEARDVYDIYILSRKIKPLHIFLQDVPGPFQKGMIHWYRTFSRQELKLALMDLDIYDTGFNVRDMIVYLENEIKQFINEVIGEWILQNIFGT